MEALSIPSTIKAIVQSDVNSTHLVLTAQPTPIPQPNSDEHLIRVHAAAFCNGELLWDKNYPSRGNAHKILIPCDDFAGTVVSAPANSPFVAGSEVYARTSHVRSGNAREYTIAVTSELAFRPTNISWAESACVPLSALTAWQALFVHAGLAPPTSVVQSSAAGKRILVLGAAGAVGIWIVQLAKLVGADVVGTAGADSIEFVKSLGATEVFDYRTVNLKEWAASRKKVDIVIDCFGGNALRDARWTVRPGGLLMSIRQPQMLKPDELDVEVKTLFFIMEPNGAQLQKITNLINVGNFKVKVDSIWSLDQYSDALERFENGRPKGKVVFGVLATSN
ncbi:NAD(P)-binding Rossmann-fold containing protein [Glarea lozoyensis ATCC 20868]|uniref:NAD(P)-binding Rossmann-fold containing protein n=1 Tax=Glarea lozoyensis (strain ATCC 20868 / MF5171) TaxID=1116229 RepID=S3D6P6_GLAL2|nr:NAD(P)-binding Rossmann-fold containing protein [Glarea lozoyensis ATCC 20868]EPE34172.1 NAD(P)-binding Rossmann-fold containing protein [Glarea lozoyensis ATCC 20868]